MSDETSQKSVAAVPMGVDGAEGVTAAKWFVAITAPRHEKAVAEQLAATGIETYVALQREMHQWANGRRKMVDRVVISSVVFVRCTERQHRAIVGHPSIYRFMTNRAADSGTLRSPVATVPDREIAKLKFMLGQSDIPVDFTPQQFRQHDNVRVIRGSLRGLEGTVMQNPDGTHTLRISLSILGGATVRIPLTDLEKI